MLAAIRKRFPWLRHIFADGGYAGDKLRSALVGMGKWRSSRRPAKLDHQAIGQGERLPGAAPQMGGRTDFCLPRALSSALERLGAIHRLVNSLGPHRLNPHAHTQNCKILSELKNFRILLLQAKIYFANRVSLPSKNCR